MCASHGYLEIARVPDLPPVSSPVAQFVEELKRELPPGALFTVFVEQPVPQDPVKLREMQQRLQTQIDEYQRQLVEAEKRRGWRTPD
jgi:hypothetical protein